MDQDCGKKISRFLLAGWLRSFFNCQREMPELKRYLANQKEHHRKQTFQEELIQFLEEYGIEYDERYLWN